MKWAVTSRSCGFGFGCRRRYLDWWSKFKKQHEWCGILYVAPVSWWYININVRDRRSLIKSESALRCVTPTVPNRPFYPLVSRAGPRRLSNYPKYYASLSMASRTILLLSIKDHETAAFHRTMISNLLWIFIHEGKMRRSYWGWSRCIAYQLIYRLSSISGELLKTANKNVCQLASGFDEENNVHQIKQRNGLLRDHLSDQSVTASQPARWFWRR